MLTRHPPWSRGLRLLATLALVVGAAGGCGPQRSPSHDDLGQVKLGLTLSPGVTIDAVSYQITGNGIAARNGTIDVTNAVHATALVSDLPVADGYVAAMDARSTDGRTTCHGSTMFSIAGPQQTVTAIVILQCRAVLGPTAGAVAINGRLDNCPVIAGFSASSLEAGVGSAVAVAVTVADADPADTLDYVWSAIPINVGTFSNVRAASTSFICLNPGSTLLSIATSDGVCSDENRYAIPISCVPGSGMGPPLGTIIGTPLGTFDTTLDDFVLNTDSSSVLFHGNGPQGNLAYYQHFPRAELSQSATEGSPAPGALVLSAPYSGGCCEFVQIYRVLSAPQDWSGRTLHARVKVASGTFHGVAQLFATSPSGGPEWGYAGVPSDGSWHEVTLDVSHPPDFWSGYDPTQVVVFGIQFHSGESVGTPVVFDVDSFSIDPPIVAGDGGAD